MRPSERVLVSVEGLDELLAALRREEYRLVGPTVRDGAIVLADITSTADLPVGWTEEQEAGCYRLRRRGDRALFGYSLGPHPWKPFFFVPRLRLFRARRNDSGFVVEPDPPRSERLAIIGARACDLHAIAVQDRVFLHGPFVDTEYAARRADVFVVAVQCGQAGGTCFCVSMRTGPRAEEGFDLALTELLEGAHRFVVEVGSERGAALLAKVPCAPAEESDCRQAEAMVAATAASMRRNIDTENLKELLYRNLEHPRWNHVAQRCLSCANCTLVCPTCFCSTVEDATDLEGTTAERWRRWDSCFTLDHSYIHGGSIRSTIRSRYRQWLVHKLASWIDQFGTSGCVGCGRCITWCPAGIDLTEEVAAIRAGDGETL